MSVDRTNNTEESMFVGTPVWERNGKKRGGLGFSKPAARPVTTTAEPIAPTATARTVRSDAAPAVRRTTTARSSAGPTAAIAAGVVAVVVIGGGAWYAMQNRDTSVAVLTPGVETAPLAPTTTLAASTAVTPPVAPQAAAPVTRAAAPERLAANRVRPAAATAASAEDVGVNTSATLPDAPMPYAQANPDAAAAAPTPAAPVIAPPVAETAPAADPPATDPLTVNPAPLATAETPTAPAEVVPPQV